MKKLVCSSLLIVGALSAACTKTPGSPTAVSFTVPLAGQPSSGSSYKFKEQPVSLSITNVVRTGDAPTTYSVEVASDSAFANKVFTKDSIAEGAGGTTGITLGSLPASSGDATYYWRWKATVEGVATAYSATQNFMVRQQIVVNAPTPSTPTNGVTLTELRPTFVIKNATRQGAVGTISYLFQVSPTAAFSEITASATVTEQSGGQTSWKPNVDLPGKTLFWRAQASDPANAETSGFSGSLSLTVQPFDPTKAIFLNNPGDIATWSETAKITSVDFSSGYLIVDFDAREGKGGVDEWREAGFGDDSGIQYTLGMCFNISGQWYCSAPVQFWTGRDLEASGPWDSIAGNWYYDPARWGAMTGHQPQIGELVAVWVGHGNLRGSGNTYKERSNFVLIPFGQNYIAPK